MELGAVGGTAQQGSIVPNKVQRSVAHPGLQDSMSGTLGCPQSLIQAQP